MTGMSRPFSVGPVSAEGPLKTEGRSFRRARTNSASGIQGLKPLVVRIIQIRTLKTEVDNGSMSTVIGHGLVGPKEWVNSENMVLCSFGDILVTCLFRKGKRLIFRYLGGALVATQCRSSARLSDPRGEFSFLFYSRTSLE